MVSKPILEKIKAKSVNKSLGRKVTHKMTIGDTKT